MLGCGKTRYLLFLDEIRGLSYCVKWFGHLCETFGQDCRCFLVGLDKTALPSDQKGELFGHFKIRFGQETENFGQVSGNFGQLLQIFVQVSDNFGHLKETAHQRDLSCPY
jgi:hypothetical protein